VEGKVPLLAKDAGAVAEMVAAVREQLKTHTADPPLFADGKAEQTIVWEERGVVCRMRADWIRDDLRACDDLKTTSRSANPRTWSRSLFGLGYDLQAAFYVRGIEQTTGETPEFRLAVVETTPPYALSVIGLAPEVMTIARKKFDYALDLWRTCLEKNEWPAYPPKVAYAELPAWEESAWLERELEAVG
jgi:hypothetical protein